MLTDVVAAYLDYLKDSKRGGAKELLARQQERKLKLQNNRLADTLVNIDEAAEVFRIACCLWRDGANAIPNNVAARIAKTKSKREIRDILTEALDGLVPAFEEPIKEITKDAAK